MLIEAKDNGSGGDDWRYVVQSSSQIITANKPTPNFIQAGCPSCRPTNSVESKHGRELSYSMDLLTPSSPGGLSTWLWPLTAPGYLGGGLPCLSSAVPSADASTPAKQHHWWWRLKKQRAQILLTNYVTYLCRQFLLTQHWKGFEQHFKLNMVVVGVVYCESFPVVCTGVHCVVFLMKYWTGEST